MKNYVVHPSAFEELSEPQKRWRSWQKLVNQGKKGSAQPTPRSKEYRAKVKAARKANRRNQGR